MWVARDKERRKKSLAKKIKKINDPLYYDF